MENINQDDAPILSETQPENIVNAKRYSPNNPPWNSIVAFFLWFVSVLLIAVVPALFLLPHLINQRIGFSDGEALVRFTQSDPTSLMLQIGAIIPAHLITLVLAWVIVTRLNTFSFTEMLGWKWGGFRWWHAVFLLASVFAMMLATSSIFGQQDNDLMRILRSSRVIVFMVAFMATFSAPIVEEVVYRGVLYSAFQRSFGIPLAVVFVTLVFSAVHFPQYWGDYSTLITLTFLSLVITLIRVKTNNLLPCILFHFVVNGLQSIVLILEPYLPEALNATKPVGQIFHFI